MGRVFPVVIVWMLCSACGLYAADSGLFSGLHEAVRHHDAAVVRNLLDGGAPANHPDHDYRTPLHHAARRGDLALMALLLERGADVHAVDRDGNTPLHATFYNRPQSVLLLLERGADINARNHLGNTLLHNSVFFPSVVDVLLRHDADIHLENQRGLTPLAIASIAGREDVATRLVDAGGDLDGALFNAVAQGRAETVRTLLAQGADIHARDADGHALLHKALMTRVACAGIVGILLDAGADVHAVADRAPMAYGSTHTLRRQQPLHLAVRGRLRPYPYLEISERLIEAGADVNAEDGHGSTPFLYAIRRGAHFRRLYPEYPALVRLLIRHGADVNRSYPGGRTPLHYAAGLVSPHYSAGIRGNDAIVEILIESGLEVDARDDQGRTPLHEAARVCQRGHHWEHRRLNAEALIVNGADVHARDKHRQTPLHLAALAGSVRNVLLLLEHGARISDRDHDGKTAPALAAEQGHEDLLTLFQAQEMHPGREG